MIKNIQIVKKLTVLALLLGLLSCGGNAKKEDQNYVKVGVIAGPEHNVAEIAKKVAKEKYNLDVELVVFDDYVMPNEALSHGDIDINVYQSFPFFEEQLTQRGYKFINIGKTFIFPMAGYSKQIKTLEELKEGSSITIPNDAANGGRALLLLEKQGLIKLKDGVGILPKVIDIIENSKNLKIIELDAPQLPRSLDDQTVALSVINNTFSVKAGYTIDKAVFVEDKNSPYVNVIVTNEHRKDEDKIERFVKAYQSDEVNEAAIKEFKGGAIKGWD